VVPIRLYLRDFMSYGDQGEELNFSFHVACLSGNNGDGKSALLDAMTWALFGVARGLSASGAGADDLIRTAPGVNEAVVELDFRIGDQIYRVRRSRHRKRGGSLELAAWDGQEFRRLTSLHKRDTQQMLLDLLRMDYETFVSSSFLLQGQADRFTTQTPSERKRILAQILGLGRYDVLEERAREKAKAAKAAARQHQEEITRLEEQAAQAEECRAQLERCAAAVTAAESHEQGLQQEEREAQAALNDLLQKQERLRQLEVQYSGLMADRERIAEQARPLQKRLEAKRALVARREEIEVNHHALQQARAEDQEMAQKLAAFNRLAEQQQVLMREVEIERQRLQSALEHLEGQWRDLESKASLREALQEKMARLEQQQVRLRTGRERLDAIKGEQAQAAAEAESLARSNDELSQRLAELKQRLEMLYETAEPRCPLCESELDEEKRRQLVSRLQAQGQQDSEKVKAQAASIRQVEAGLAGRAAEQEDLEAQLAAAEELPKNLGELSQQLEHARQAAEQQQEVGEQTAELRRRLEGAEYAAEARAGLQQCREGVAQLGYDAERHRQAALEARRLAEYERLKVELEQALVTAQEEAAALEALAEGERGKAASAEACLEQGKALQAELGLLAAAQQRLEGVKGALAAAAEDSRRLAQESARWQERWERCEEARAAREGRAADKRQAEREGLIYSELATAFSKRGIQAIIIENVVPQLVADANELLCRLTAGQMQVAIVTRSTSGRGEPQETLEILLSDQMGTRRYELYSGGEAFRANFAVRIALSRLLAQRAGAKLQTLVLDEGFGTQDSQGRERLVDAIHAVAGDFERILVITHIDDLKEAFAYRVEVTKDEKGSHLAVIG